MSSTHNIDPQAPRTIYARPTAPAAATTKATRALLSCGTVAGPLFVVVALIQAFTRDGFDLRRHPFSMLSLGDLGWVQIVNFVVSGLLFLTCAIGIRRVLRGHRGGTWGPLLIGTFGVAQIGGGVFVADPALGFPAGTGDGAPESVSWHSTVHGLAFAIGMIALITVCFVIARAFAASGDRGWSRYSTFTGIAFVALGGLGAGLGDWRIVALAVVLGWGWAALVAARLRSTSLQLAREAGDI
ncbi:DUF998 domain-containing protein [Streptomyces sp. SID13031]|uniref:DUF998 domain-containing protein n=1 Tax=Streptomyces sp. SID13031 TaxID=2706046 RepID=UPI0013C5A730|nr:DUF998 domain-containing protein [Streptomyces sp. SID13031]NEA36587.1 DUF998 domain-containing protein [Streptomyces sp. SID13031]